MKNESAMHKMVVLVPFRNAGRYIIDCVNSFIVQEYDNYEVYMLDDASDDGTMDLIDREYDFIHKLRNAERGGALRNICNALMTIPIDDDDIVILVDGDDYVFGEYAFQIVNERYAYSTALLTYGMEINNFGHVGWYHMYSQEQFDNLRRSAPFMASHLKTFKYKLFKELLKQDPTLSRFKFPNGQFYMHAYDVALMFSLMEIAGIENIAFISNVNYCRRLHPQNESASLEGRELQLLAEKSARSHPPFNRVF